MGHLINPISFRVGFFGYWLDNWSPWQYYAYAEMLHQNLVLRELLKEFLDGEFMRKASFFYSHFTIQYYEQKRFVIKIYYYDGLTEQVVQCVSAYWAKWAMKRNKLYKKKIRRFKFVKKTFVKDNLLFWWRYVDYNFASKIIWFLFLMMTLSFEKKNRRSRGRRHYNYRFHKQRLKFLKRKRFLFTIDQYIKLLRRLRFNKRRFNFFKKIFFFYYRANFRRLWYTFLLRDPHFEVFSFLRVFFMLFFKYIRFAYYKRRFLNRTLLYKRIKQKFNKETNSIIDLFNYNKFARKIINPAHMGVHPNFFMQHPYVPKKFKLKNRKLAVILKNFRWMWHYYFIHKHIGLKHYRLRLKYIYGDRVPYYIYNLPKRFFFSKRFLNKKVRFLRAQTILRKISYSKFYKTFFHLKKKRRRRFFLDEKKISNINRFYKKYVNHLRFIILGGSKRIAANFYDNRWKFKNIKYKSIKNGYFVQLRYKQQAYRFLTNNITLLRKLRKIYKNRYFVFRSRYQSRHPGFIRSLIKRRKVSKRALKFKKEKQFRYSFRKKLTYIHNFRKNIFLKQPFVKNIFGHNSSGTSNQFFPPSNRFSKKWTFRNYNKNEIILKHRNFTYWTMYKYLKQNWFNTSKKFNIGLKNKRFIYYFYSNYMRGAFLKYNFSKNEYLKYSRYILLYKQILNKKMNLLRFLRKIFVRKHLNFNILKIKSWNKKFNCKKNNLFKVKKSNFGEFSKFSGYGLISLKKYFADFKWKFKYQCFKILYKFILMRKYVYSHGMASYIQYIKKLELQKLKNKNLYSIKTGSKSKFFIRREKKLNKSLLKINYVNKKKIDFSLYMTYKNFLQRSKFYKNIFNKQYNMKLFLYKTDLIFVQKLLRRYKFNVFNKRLEGYFRRPFKQKDSFEHKTYLGNNLKIKIANQHIKTALPYFNKNRFEDHAMFLSLLYLKNSQFKDGFSLLNWRFLIVFVMKTNKSIFNLINIYLRLTKKGVFFSIKSYYWVILILWFWFLLVRKRLNNLKSKNLVMFIKSFFRYNKYRNLRFLKDKKRAIWLTKYNKDFFYRKRKSYVTTYDFLWLKKFRLGLNNERENNFSNGLFNFYRKKNKNFQKSCLKASLIKLVKFKKQNKTDLTYISSKYKHVINKFNWLSVNARFNFLVKLLFWKDNTQYFHLWAVNKKIFSNLGLNLTFYKKNLIGLSKLKKKVLQLNFFFSLKVRLAQLYKLYFNKQRVNLNSLGDVIKFKNFLRKYKIIVEKTKKNKNYIYRSSKYMKRYQWYHTRRISHQKILRRRLYRHLMKIGNYSHSDIYVNRINIPSNKWKHFSFCKKFSEKMQIASVKSPNFYFKRLVFLRSYWLYGLFSYYFVQRRAQFLYILNRERQVVDLIEPLYVYFSHYRITDIICRRLVMGFVRSLLVMERFRIQFMYFEQKFIELCRNFVLYPFTIRFYGIDNDIVTAVFIARYISAKLEYKFNVWELFKPIGKDLKIVSRGTKMLLGYKLQFIGRLRRRDRLRYVYNMGGSLPLSKHDAFIEHGYFTGILKNGKCSVRVWIYRHKSFADFFFNYLYVLY